MHARWRHGLGHGEHPGAKLVRKINAAAKKKKKKTIAHHPAIRYSPAINHHVVQLTTIVRRPRPETPQCARPQAVRNRRSKENKCRRFRGRDKHKRASRSGRSYAHIPLLTQYDRRLTNLAFLFNLQDSAPTLPSLKPILISCPTSAKRR